MSFEFLLALFLMGVGLSIAGMGTHLYQGVAGQPAMLRFDGANVPAMLGNLAMSFVCGPYIMLRLGLTHEQDGTISMTNAFIGASVALGWAFITGLLFVGTYLALAS